MSNELSASETTPLRRPESQNIEDVSSSSSLLATPRDVGKANHNYNHNININHNSSGTAPTTPTPTVVTDNFNNNNTEVHLDYSTRGGHNKTPQQQQRHTRSEMDTNKRILCRVGLDILILLCVGIPILCFFLWGDSYKRGFFCDDESLKHPFKDSTIRNWMLYIIGLVLPIGMMVSVEIFKSRQAAKNSNGNAIARRYTFMEYEIPDWLVECYKKIGVFGFGAAVSQLTTDIAKYSIGRLRPHFFTVCQPIMKDGTTCDDPINAGKYIEEFDCRGAGSSDRMLKEMRLSFPSGHSSFTFYTMVYMALYLQSRMTWRGSKLLRHFLQFLLIMIAWYTALSRVSDYKHHWSDVLAGSAVGAFTAVIVANYVSDLFRDRNTKSYLLPCTAQDTSTQSVATNSH